eukprot:2984210-Rhodomonas_salina.4
MGVRQRVLIPPAKKSLLYQQTYWYPSEPLVVFAVERRSVVLHSLGDAFFRTQLRTSASRARPLLRRYYPGAPYAHSL